MAVPRAPTMLPCAVVQRRGGDCHHREASVEAAKPNAVPPNLHRRTEGVENGAGAIVAEEKLRRLADQRTGWPAKRIFRNDKDEAALGIGFERQIGRQGDEVSPALTAFDQCVPDEVL